MGLHGDWMMIPVSYGTLSADQAGRAGTVGPALALGVLTFLTIVDLFAAQAILPALTLAYGTSPAVMGLAVNACTIGMALSGLAMSVLGSRVPSRTGIAVSLALLTLPTMLLATMPALPWFALLRVTQGLCMAAAFTLTLAEAGGRGHGIAAGAVAACITGNVASNLLGRLLAAAVADHGGLAATFLVFAGLNLAGCVLALGTLRSSPRTSPTRLRWPGGVLRPPHLRAAYAIGFCILFAFIGVFTYVNFVLVSPAFGLPMMALGAVYLVFLPSIITTPWAGRIAGSLGPTAAVRLGLGLALIGLPALLAGHLAVVLAGLSLIAIGTFLAQAVVAGYVGSQAGKDRAAASGLYLACYFVGGLAGSLVVGLIFDGLGWPASAGAVGCVLGIAAWLARWLRA